MIDAVLLFGVMNTVFELVLLGMIAPRWRLRILGSTAACNVLHCMFLVVNVLIHWGTLIGTMSGIFAFVASVVTVRVARALFGHIQDGRFYHVGWIKYHPSEIK